MTIARGWQTVDHNTVNGDVYAVTSHDNKNASVEEARKIAGANIDTLEAEVDEAHAALARANNAVAAAQQGVKNATETLADKRKRLDRARVNLVHLYGFELQEAE